MSIDSTRAIMLRYLDANHNDNSVLADDVVFTIMATGQEHHGRAAVISLLDHFYHIAFDATATVKVSLFGEQNAMIEADFVGRHIGYFEGIIATGKVVHVPLCVVYDLEQDQIKRGRIYFEMPALLQQLGL